MTSIVGLKHNGDVYIGADSLMAFDWDIALPLKAKVFRNGEFLIGGVGTSRLSQLLQYSFMPPPLPETISGDDLTRYMVTEFAVTMRACLVSSGSIKIENSKEDTESAYIVGVHGRLFRIGCDYLVMEERVDYITAGSGGQVANGAMFATEGMPPADRILCALEASERFSMGVRGPFVIECLPAKKLEAA